MRTAMECQGLRTKLIAYPRVHYIQLRSSDFQLGVGFLMPRIVSFFQKSVWYTHFVFCHYVINSVFITVVLFFQS